MTAIIRDLKECGDISLGDFWGYEKGPAKDFGDEKGLSLVLINTEKGMEVFEKIKNNLECFEISKEDCYPYNCFTNFKAPENLDEMWKAYFQNGFEAFAK